MRPRRGAGFSYGDLVMTDKNKTARPHSAECFGADRDFFWNPDFLELIARRLDLGAVQAAADVGCGVGHWSTRLYPHLATGARLVGIDRERSHVADYLRRVRSVLPNPASVSAFVAEAERLPLPDRAYDLATCQTLLLHLAHPEAALAEMIRITRPGGLVLCVEPNNLVGRLPFSGLMDQHPPDRLVHLSELAWRYVVGRARRGLGAEFVGERLPGLLAGLGLEAVQVWLSDRAALMIPPYASAAERAAREAVDEWRSEGIGPFDRDEARANVLAGGGSPDFFETAWETYLAYDREATRAQAEMRWHAAGGALLYIVAGRVPI